MPALTQQWVLDAWPQENKELYNEVMQLQQELQLSNGTYIYFGLDQFEDTEYPWYKNDYPTIKQALKDAGIDSCMINVSW